MEEDYGLEACLRWLGRLDRKRETTDRVAERDRGHRFSVRKRFPIRPLELIGVKLFVLRSVGHGGCVPSAPIAHTRTPRIGGTMAG